LLQKLGPGAPQTRFSLTFEGSQTTSRSGWTTPTPGLGQRDVHGAASPWQGESSRASATCRGITARKWTSTFRAGASKFTLGREVPAGGLRDLLAGRADSGSLDTCRTLTGWQPLERILEVDQTPIGRTPRSCPATYVGLWDPIRKLFAATAEARIRGWGHGHFSFTARARA